MKDFYWTSLYNDSNRIYYSTIGIDSTGSSIYFDKLIRVEALEGNFMSSDTFMPKIYYTTADNFFSKSTTYSRSRNLTSKEVITNE